MPIKLLNSADGDPTVHDCTAPTVTGQGTWADDGGGGVTYAPEANNEGNRQGSNCVRYGVANASLGILKMTLASGSIDMTANEIGVWFLLVKSNRQNEAPVLKGTAQGASGDSLRLRVYTGTAYADFYQGDNDTLPGGWIYLRASGDNHDGTMSGTVNFAAIDAIGVYTDNNVENDYSKGDAYYKVDMLVAYNKIEITGFNTAVGPSEDWNPDTIYDLCVTTKDDVNNLKSPDDYYWGQIIKNDIFYKYLTGVRWGDGTVSTGYQSRNRYLLFDPFHSDVNSNLEFTDNIDVEFGRKNQQTQDTYAQDGTQVVARSGLTTRPSITIRDGATIGGYASFFRGWNVINMGDGYIGTASPLRIEFIKCDFFDNTTLEFRSEALAMTNCRIHFPEGSEAPCGVVYQEPALLDQIEVFQVTDGLAFRVSATIQNSFVGDATIDFKILDGQTLTCINTSYDANSIRLV